MKFGPVEMEVIEKALREFLENDPNPIDHDRACEILLKIDLMDHY